MKEETGDIWEKHAQGHWIVITTNGSVKKNGEAVMGRGIALQAKERYPDLAVRLGQAILDTGNKPYVFRELRIITLPVKHAWYEQADIELIRSSIVRLRRMWFGYEALCFLVRPGCGNGGLNWSEVKPICEKYLNDDRFIVIEKNV